MAYRFEREFFNAMPHGDTAEWAFDNFKKKATEAGGIISDDLMSEFREEVQRGLSQSLDNLEMMEEEDYI